MCEPVFASNLRPQTKISGLGRPTICKQLQLNVELQIFTSIFVGANYSEHTRLWRVVREGCQTCKFHRICGQIDVWSKQVCGLHANGSNISLLSIFIIIGFLYNDTVYSANFILATRCSIISFFNTWCFIMWSIVVGQN